MSEREEGFLSGVEAAAQVCTDIADKHHKKYHEAVAGQPTHIAFGEWSGAQDCYLALAALTPPPDGAKHWLGELLAVLHRDGGHYTATHGIEKSAKDALEEITRLKVAADGAEAQANKDYADCFRIARELAKLSPGESLFDWIQARVAEHEQRPPLRKGLTMADLARLRDWKQIAATTRQLGRYDARSRVICYTAADAIEEMVAELKQLQDDNATLRAAQKACEHCDSGIAAVVEDRAREIAEAMPSGMFEMSNAEVSGAGTASAGLPG